MIETKITPLALQTLDRQLGTETVSAFEHAVDIAPHLGGLAIVLDNSTGSTFQPSELGLAGSLVRLNPDRDYYTGIIKSGIVGARLGEFSRFFRERGVMPSVNELMTSVLLHELGHADDLEGYVQQAGGNTKAAFKLASEVRKSELATLPLKAASSRAQRAWEGNIKGYRDKMRARGITDGKWSGLVLRNTEAYSNLPCEKVADRFALGVLATMYS